MARLPYYRKRRGSSWSSHSSAGSATLTSWTHFLLLYIITVGFTVLPLFYYHAHNAVVARPILCAHESQQQQAAVFEQMTASFGPPPRPKDWTRAAAAQQAEQGGRKVTGDDTNPIPTASTATAAATTTFRTHHLNESFSACLLTKDDGHFLVEWLAYHYHALPLRRLIVAVDPNSKTSPSGIFNRWRKNGRMKIDEWTDTHFAIKLHQNKTGLVSHRLRQMAFNKKCLERLAEENRTWTLMIDVDEYLCYNTYYAENASWTAEADRIEKPGSFLAFLKETPANKNGTQGLQDVPCIVMPRVRYGSVESSAEQVANQVPKAFNGSAFQTLRYRKYGAPLKYMLHGPGKTIIDVSRIDAKSIEMKESPHLPVQKSCSKELLWERPDKTGPLAVRHYLGSPEQFFYRDDARQKKGMKTDKTYQKYKDLNDGEDDAIRPWTKGFVKDVGHDVAMELLNGVGNVSVAPPILAKGS